MLLSSLSALLCTTLSSNPIKPTPCQRQDTTTRATHQTISIGKVVRPALKIVASFNDIDFNSAAGLRKMSRREREEVWRRAQARVTDPYSMHRQRSGAYANMGNIAAVEDARSLRHRLRNGEVDEVADRMSRLNRGDRGSHCHSRREARFYD